ncbi:DoxX family protein [Microbispora sp. CA-102843]|uniref:DoxX family protein n=1 Tax=Microbispora sp. CA-102843 TaxID=3239952 RepID=UPI003D8C1A77
MASVDAGLLVLRVVAGLLLLGHGLQKSFGWLDGDGLAKTASIFEKVGYRPGRQMALVAAVMEITTGLGVVVGLLTPLAAAGMLATMLVAASVHWRNGLWATGKGFELPLMYGLIALALGFCGPGRYSLDGLIGWQLARPWTGWAAFALGVLGAAPVIARRAQAR